MHVFPILLVLIAIIQIGRSADCKKEIKCQISRVFGMRAADCSNRVFRSFPQCLRADIEVIDLAMNRIRRLRYSDLKRYRHLKALYLQDNLLSTIAADTFDGLDDLTGLDLSGAVTIKIPENIFHLPSLQTLYLSNQLFTNIVEAIEKTKPITSPLAHLDLSYSELERLPNMGVLPTLLKYNVSGNNLTELRVEHFSGLCGLNYLINQNINLSLSNPCDCWSVNNWLKNKVTDFTPFDCQLKENLCESVPFNISDIVTHQDCRIKLKEISTRTFMRKVLLPAAIAFIIILVCVVCYCRGRRRLNKPPQYRIPAEEESVNSFPLKKFENS